MIEGSQSEYDLNNRFFVKEKQTSVADMFRSSFHRGNAI